MKRKTLLVICIASLLVGLALIPATTGRSVQNPIVKENKKNIENDSFIQVFEKYADEIEEIQKYTEKHLDLENPDLFIFPNDLQEKVDKIVSELKSYCTIVQGSNDGITKLEIKNHYILWFYIGFEAWLYMNHDYIENNLELGLNMGTAGLALLLLALGTVTMGVAWIFATFLIFWGLDKIQDCDQGRGVVLYFSISGAHWVLPTIFPPIMGPQ